MELASALADGDHTVRNKAVIENGVALVENVNVVSDLNLERALNDNVKLLTVVGVELHRSVLLFGNVREFYKERLGELALEGWGEVVVLNAVLLQDLKTVAASCDSKGGKSCAVTLKQINDLNAASLCAFINKSETEIRIC